MRIRLWRVTGKPAGVHAVPFTSSGKVVLVKLSYATGWRVPGGGVKRGEAPEEAAVRELTEEIGMTRHGGIRRIDEARPTPDGALFALTDVEYRPGRSLEIESVMEFAPESLPPDVSPFARRWILRALAQCGRP
jgi:8-oxo-dGTP pyrophosphatase MutT (NUDIX family)